MDAVKYLKELNRMCTKSHTCDDCPIYRATKQNCGMAYSNAEMLAGHVGIVEQWAKEHPARTRQSVFLERYPGAVVDDCGNVIICPNLITGEKCGDIRNGMSLNCDECKSQYWSQEVPDDD